MDDGLARSKQKTGKSRDSLASLEQDARQCAHRPRTRRRGAAYLPTCSLYHPLGGGCRVHRSDGDRLLLLLLLQLVVDLAELSTSVRTGSWNGHGTAQLLLRAPKKQGFRRLFDREERYGKTNLMRDKSDFPFGSFHSGSCLG